MRLAILSLTLRFCSLAVFTYVVRSAFPIPPLLQVLVCVCVCVCVCVHVRACVRACFKRANTKQIRKAFLRPENAQSDIDDDNGENEKLKSPSVSAGLLLRCHGSRELNQNLWPLVC